MEGTHITEAAIMSTSRSVRPTPDGLRVVGAGLPRTGTRSLSIALELLLGGTCYHMMTLLERGGVDVPTFLTAVRGVSVDWTSVFRNCCSAVDWPASALWRAIAAANPNSLIVLSQRDSAESWWRSVDKAGYERWNDDVRASVPPQRLIVWRPRDGWKPLCDGFDVPIPDVPFPHVNSADEFVQRSGLDR